METITFHSPISDPRPIRLSYATRFFAKESLDGKYGKDALATRYIQLTEEELADAVTDRDRYDRAILAIAKRAPLRVVKGEKLCGAATLGAAISHVVPATIDGKNPVCGSVSHLTANFGQLFTGGVDDLYEKLKVKQAESALTDYQTAVLRSVENTYTALKIYHARYLTYIAELLSDAETEEDRVYYSELYDNLAGVPFRAPRTFREGLQSVWFVFSFMRLCGNWPGIGRVDFFLQPLYDKDIADGRLTEAEARELLAHFFIKGCEWINLQFRGSGDAQHYQNLVLGGCDSDGMDRTGDVTRLMLEVVEELPIPDYPIAVRVSGNSPAWLKRKMAEVIRFGSGVVAMYNETLIIDSLVRFGYDIREARRFANDGCWEIQIPGKTRFGYSPMDLYGVFENEVLHSNDAADAPIPEYADFEALYQAFRDAMDRTLDAFHNAADHYFFDMPTGVIDLFEEGCIEKACAYYNSGPVYNVSSPHFGGIPDTANALYAIRRLVFEEKKVTLPAFIRILRNNWEGEEALRLYVRNHYTYYGNDNDDVDLLLARIVKDYIADCRKTKARNNVLRPPGISTFGRQIDWKDMRAASPHGFKRGDILAGNISPTPSTDHTGATAIIRSACKTDFSDLTCGTVLDIRLDPKAAAGESGVTAIEGLLTAFCELGGFFLQIDVVDSAVLKEAQKHPEQYPSLAVRISGWSARFVTLDENWQKMVIERTEQGIG